MNILRLSPGKSLVLGLFVLLCASCAPSFVVNSEADIPDINPGDGNCATADNNCTLRAALMEANAGTGAKITFENVSTITPATALPPITVGGVSISGNGAVTLDGGQNLDCNGFAGLEIHGSSYNIIQGLTIINFGTGISINSFYGESKTNIIGYNTNNAAPIATQRNVIGGNCRGVYITGQNAFGNTVSGNYVGTDSSGSAANPNHSGILLVAGTHDNLIGAYEPGNTGTFNSADLVAYWNMDEGSGNALDAYGANDLTDNNTVGANNSGKINGARDFEEISDEFFSINDNTDLSMGVGTPLSISAWVKLESKPSHRMVVVSKASTGATEYILWWNYVTDRYVFTVGDGSATTSVAANGFGTPSTGEWYFLFAYHDPFTNEIGISINGGVPNTAPHSTDIQDGTQPFRIGLGFGPAFGHYMDGLIDEVGLWKRVLPPQEIAALYNNGLGTAYGFGDPASNVISGNQSTGISLTGADHNRISGNFVGTTPGGFTPLPNSTGIYLTNGADNNSIGLVSPDQGSPNVVSGNLHDGIQLSTGNNNTITGNFIGTDITGTQDLGNGESGIALISASNGNVIGTNGDGTSDDIEGNVIGGNGALFTRQGIWIQGSNNVVAGNRIGTNIDASATIPNNGTGITITGNNNRVGTNGDGTSDALEANIISGNGTDGVFIGSAFNQISGNFIGTNANGDTGLGNTYTGVRLTAAAHDNIIGTNGDGAGDLAERNVISGNSVGMNGSAGVGIQGANNVVAGNYIGINPAGTAALGNQQYGITISGASASGNRIGTDGDGLADAAEGNVISGNGWMSLFINEADNNWVAGNLIGTNAAGLAAVPNGYGANEQLPGIELRSGASGNLIGTNGDGVADAAERNVVSSNARAGIGIDGQGTTNNIVAGNYIGVDASGSVALGNSGVGIFLSGGSSGTRVGTDGNGVADAAEANVISGNTSIGMQVIVSASNLIAGNFIGTDKTGTAPIGNGLEGIQIYSSNVGGTNSNTIGGTPQKANVIAFNQSEGVEVGGISSYPINTAILYNSIFSNGSLGINLSPGDGFYAVTANDAGDADSGANNLMNFPELTAALSMNNNITISGDLVDSLPNTNFEIQFFSSPDCDPSGYGEGKTFVGESTEMTNGSGDVSFLLNFAVTVDAGNFITATATNSNNTSEFSECVEVLAGSQMNLDLGEGFNITPLRNLNCRNFCTQASDIADTLLEGITYTPVGWDPILGFLAFDGPSFGERCFVPPSSGSTPLMALSFQGQEVTTDQITPDMVATLACPPFSTPTPTVDVDEGENGRETETPFVPQCSDGIDNDGDRLIDYSATGAGDRECRDANDNDEANP